MLVLEKSPTNEITNYLGRKRVEIFNEDKIQIAVSENPKYKQVFVFPSGEKMDIDWSKGVDIHLGRDTSNLDYMLTCIVNHDIQVIEVRILPFVKSA